MNLGENTDKGLVFNIQRFSIDDGPGIRTTVFLKGCPLQCTWCSNPESQESYPEIMTRDVRCIGCHSCMEVCPTDAISFSEEARQIDRNKCNLCMACVEVCPTGAIARVGTYVTVDEALKEVERDRVFYQNSGGGVTISGGEPLLQWEFARELSKRCKEKGIHVALDTAGDAPIENMERVLEYVDLVLYDIKHMDSNRHRKETGVGNERILENIRRVASIVRTWLRIPLIPNFNDSEQNIRESTEFAAKLDIGKVSILPYHRWGASKYEGLGRTYAAGETSPPSEECLAEIREMMESSGLEVTIGR